MANRKLIRPNLRELQDQMPQRQPRKKQVPPSQTHAESFYYLKQMNNRTPMVAVLNDGEKLYGYIEWYDQHCIKFNRDDEPNLLLPKRNIKYLYKQEEE